MDRNQVKRLMAELRADEAVTTRGRGAQWLIPEAQE